MYSVSVHVNVPQKWLHGGGRTFTMMGLFRSIVKENMEQALHDMRSNGRYEAIAKDYVIVEENIPNGLRLTLKNVNKAARWLIDGVQPHIITQEPHWIPIGSLQRWKDQAGSFSQGSVGVRGGRKWKQSTFASKDVTYLIQAQLATIGSSGSGMIVIPHPGIPPDETIHDIRDKALRNTFKALPDELRAAWTESMK